MFSTTFLYLVLWHVDDNYSWKALPSMVLFDSKEIEFNHNFKIIIGCVLFFFFFFWWTGVCYFWTQLSWILYMRNVTKFLFGDCNYFDMLYSFFYKLMLSSLNLNNEKKNKISVIIITSVLSTFTMAQKILRIRPQNMLKKRVKNANNWN